jgi:hypothetical protein
MCNVKVNKHALRHVRTYARSLATCWFYKSSHYVHAAETLSHDHAHTNHYRLFTVYFCVTRCARMHRGSLANDKPGAVGSGSFLSKLNGIHARSCSV